MGCLSLCRALQQDVIVCRSHWWSLSMIIFYYESVSRLLSSIHVLELVFKSLQGKYRICHKMNNLIVFELYAFLICYIVITRANADSPLKNGDIRLKLTEKEIETFKMELKKSLLRETGNEKSTNVLRDPHRMFKYSPEKKEPQPVPETCNCASLLQELNDCKNKFSNQFVSCDRNETNEKITQQKDVNNGNVHQKVENNGNVQQKDENNGIVQQKDENNRNNNLETADFMYFRRLVMIMGNKLEHEEGSITITMQLSSDDVATLKKATKIASTISKDMLQDYEILTRAAENMSFVNAYSSNAESFNSVSGIYVKPAVLGVIIVILYTIFMAYNIFKNGKHSDHLVHISGWHIFWSSLIIVFIVSVWNDYLYLYQMEVTAREHKIISGMPIHCIKQNQQGMFDKILNIFWTNTNDQACLEYYQTVNVDPSVKVTLGKAVVRTLATFIMSPFTFFIGLMTDYPFYIYIPVMIFMCIIFAICLLVVFEFVRSRGQAPFHLPFVTVVNTFSHYLLDRPNSFQQNNIDTTGYQKADTTRCQKDLLEYLNGVLQNKAHGSQQLGHNAIQAGPANAEVLKHAAQNEQAAMQQVLREHLNSSTMHNTKTRTPSETGQGNGEGSNDNNLQDDDSEQSNETNDSEQSNETNDSEHFSADLTNESALPRSHQENKAETINSEKLVGNAVAYQSEGLQCTVEDHYENLQSILDDEAGADWQYVSASSMPSDCATSSDCGTCANQATNIS